MAKLEQSDYQEFLKEAQFISLDIIKSFVSQYMQRFKTMVHAMPSKTQDGVPQIKWGYTIIDGKKKPCYINKVSIDRYVFNPLKKIESEIMSDKTFSDLELSYNKFIHHKNFRYLKNVEIKVGNSGKKFIQRIDTQMPRDFIKAYQGAGAYFTAQDVIRFDGVTVPGYDRESSERILDEKTQEYKGEWHYLHAWVKQLLRINNFNLREVIAQTK